ncbi:MAG: glycosyl hydrolase [Bacteroidota bacterium]
MKAYLSLAFSLGFFFFMVVSGISQKAKKSKKPTTSTSVATTAKPYDDKLFSSTEWRNIGPWRGGRSAAVTGVPGKPNLYYFGATGGGVWRTKDGGSNWQNISDGYFGGSIGAVAVSESNHNIIYVGGGEKTLRGNVSHGYGMWKSVDAGRTWEQIGLKDSRHISRVRIHPENPDIVYVAAMGNIYKPTEERGVFRTIDGGKTWEKILYVSDKAGAVDLVLDPSNPRIMYASFWEVNRTPYSFSSGGEDSGMWKSTDGGETWEDISRNDGLPKGLLGIIGISVSPVNPDRVFAIIENEKGGVFRSDDAGKTWRKMNSSRSLRQRAWYYTRIYADTQDEDIVYVLNVRYHRSKDGGKTFTPYVAPHGDHHDLWIAPEDNQRMVIADDGGAQVSFDAGDNWSTYYNQPTAQFYRVTTDNHFPYRIYVAQQDNSTLRIAHRTSGSSIGEDDWEPTAGGESAHLAPDPVDPEIVYGGSYDGFLTRYDHRTKQRRAVNVWPDNVMGHGVEGMRYRFQWNFPIFFSPHNPKKLYTVSQHVHVSYDEGASWEIISPDLTTNDSTKMGPSGGPITKDNTSVEYYCTIFAAAESPTEEGLIWTGSDDGLLHLTKDGGENWTNVTPDHLPEWLMINCIDIDPFVDGGAYIAGSLYKTGDFQPYLYKTKDYGKTWTKITNGIDGEHFTRAIRADPKRQGLLYAGSESGMYISFDDGANWQSMQMNLPIVPITDLAIKNDNLIASTQGRGIWMIDDLTVFHQFDHNIVDRPAHLYKPMDSYKMGGRQNKNVKNAGINHPSGVMVHFYLKDKPDTTEVSLTFMEEDGTEIRTYSTNAKENADKLKVNQHGNMFNWGMNYPSAKRFDGMILWWGSLNGPTAIPRNYKVKLTVGNDSQEQDFVILKDPRSTSTPEEMQAQFDFIRDIQDKLTETHEAIIRIRDVRKQLKNYTKRLKDKDGYDGLIDLADQIDSSMTVVEKNLYQTKNQSRQDPLNFPVRLNNKLAHLNSLMRIGNYAPTKQAVAVKDEITGLIDKELAALDQVIKTELPKFNQMVRDMEINAIILDD